MHAKPPNMRKCSDLDSMLSRFSVSGSTCSLPVSGPHLVQHAGEAGITVTLIP